MQKVKSPKLKKKIIKGVQNNKILTKDTEENLLINISDNQNFTITLGNILQNPQFIIFEGYENFNPEDKSTLDASRISADNDVLVILRYFDYIIVGKFKLGYITPMILEGEKTGDIDLQSIVQAIEHRLQIELQLNVPSFEELNILDIHYLHKIKY